jgi:hypothetical protein
MTATALDRETVLRFVHGERPWTDLRALGIEIRLDDESYDEENPRQVDVAVQPADLARGFMAHELASGELRQWARVVLHASFVDFDADEGPDRETLLNALWDAAFNQPLPKDAVRVIERLAGRSAGRERPTAGKGSTA